MGHRCCCHRRRRCCSSSSACCRPANPALLRAGRDPQPERSCRDRTSCSGSNKSLPAQFWVYLKGTLPALQPRLQLLQPGSPVKQPDRRTACRRRSRSTVGARGAVGGRRAVASASSRRCARHTLLDRAAMGTALVLVSAPEFWLGLIVLFLFASGHRQVQDLPGRRQLRRPDDDPVEMVHLADPAVVRARRGHAPRSIARLMRGSLIETMDEDYIRTARAKGLPERRVVLRQGVRAAINPIVTLLGLEIGVLLGGAVLVETVFNIPGIGRLSYDSITHSDFPVDPGHGAAGRDVHHRREHPRRHRLRLPRPAGALLVSDRRAAAARRGPARRVPDRRRRRARRRRHHLPGAQRAHARDRRRVGLGQDGRLADDARPHAAGRARGSRGGSCSRAATS